MRVRLSGMGAINRVSDYGAVGGSQHAVALAVETCRALAAQNSLWLLAADSNVDPRHVSDALLSANIPARVAVPATVTCVSAAMGGRRETLLSCIRSFTVCWSQSTYT